MLSETQYKCDNVFLIIPLQKRYCKSGIRHYCENMCKLYSFKVFDNWFFVFFGSFNGKKCLQNLK